MTTRFVSLVLAASLLLFGGQTARANSNTDNATRFAGSCSGLGEVEAVALDGNDQVFRAVDLDALIFTGRQANATETCRIRAIDGVDITPVTILVKIISHFSFSATACVIASTYTVNAAVSWEGARLRQIDFWAEGQFSFLGDTSVFPNTAVRSGTATVSFVPVLSPLNLVAADRLQVNFYEENDRWAAIFLISLAAC